MFFQPTGGEHAGRLFLPIPGRKRKPAGSSYGRWALALCLSLLACHGPTEEARQTDLIMALHDTQITLEDFHQWVDRNVPSTAYGDLGAEARSRLLDQMIEERILRQAARSAGVHVTDTEVEAYIQQEGGGRELDAPGERQDLANRLTIKRFRELHLLADLNYGEDDVLAYFENHRSRYQEAPRFLIRHLFLDDEERIKKAQADLEKGVDFEEVTTAYSRAPLAGQAKWVKPEELPLPVAAALADLEPGTYTDIVESPMGFHILLLERTHGAENLEFESVRDRVETDLLREMSEMRIEQTIEAVTAREPFLFMPENLDFTYEI